VLHLPEYTHAAFTARVTGFIALSGPQSTADIAREEGLAIGMAAEMVRAIEEDGELCRDEEGAMITGGPAGGGGEVKWWVNDFRHYVWDGTPAGNGS
jgi:ESCRT-II complex subunit VPS36